MGSDHGHDPIITDLYFNTIQGKSLVLEQSLLIQSNTLHTEYWSCSNTKVIPNTVPHE